LEEEAPGEAQEGGGHQDRVGVIAILPEFLELLATDGLVLLQ
jgi:hypothetical protein